MCPLLLDDILIKCAPSAPTFRAQICLFVSSFLMFSAFFFYILTILRHQFFRLQNCSSLYWFCLLPFVYSLLLATHSLLHGVLMKNYPRFHRHTAAAMCTLRERAHTHTHKQNKQQIASGEEIEINIQTQSTRSAI